MILTAVEERLRNSTVDTLGVISRWGNVMCSDRAMRLYLAPFPEDVHTRAKLLEDLSFRLLTNGDHDPRIDVIYEYLTRRIHEMTDVARAAEPAE